MLPTPLLDRAQNWLWTRRPTGGLQRAGIALGRYALALFRDLAEGEINLRAMSLVYTSLLSLVPFLAIAFSLLKALGVHNSLEPLLLNLLAPFGSEAAVLAQQIIGFVDNIKVGVLGFVGVTLLLYTAVSLIYKVEASFNFLWKLPRAAGMPQRFGEYLALLIVGPVLVFAALGITGSVLNNTVVAELRSIEPFGTTILVLTKLAPYLLIIAMFTFLYAYIPSAKVSLRAAAIGGVAAGAGWQAASMVFAKFVSGTSNYNAIYSGFAIVIFLLLWLYLGWLILLAGCRLSFYVQSPWQMIARSAAPAAASREVEWAALLIVVLVFRRFTAGKPPLTRTELHRLSGAPEALAGRCIADWIDSGVLAETADGQLLPACDAGTLTLDSLWLKARGATPTWALGAEDAPTIRSCLAQIEQAATAHGPRGTLRDWLDTEPRTGTSAVADGRSDKHEPGMESIS